MLQVIFEPIFASMVDLLTNLLSTPDIKNISFVFTSMIYAQVLASILLFSQFVFRVWNSMSSRAFSGQSEPLSFIMWRTLLSGFLIYAMPHFLDWLIQLNAALIELIGRLGVDFQRNIKSIEYPQAADLSIVLFFIVWIVALVGLVISNAMRLAELCFLYVIGPILAVSYAGKGETFNIWIIQSVAVTFTQAVQFWLVGASLNFTVDMASNLTINNLLLPIGTAILAVMGPTVLKNLLYTSGAGQALTGGVKSGFSTVVYAKMMKK